MVISQRSTGLCTRCTRANTFPVPGIDIPRITTYLLSILPKSSLMWKLQSDCVSSIFPSIESGEYWNLPTSIEMPVFPRTLQITHWKMSWQFRKNPKFGNPLLWTWHTTKCSISQSHEINFQKWVLIFKFLQILTWVWKHVFNRGAINAMVHSNQGS